MANSSMTPLEKGISNVPSNLVDGLYIDLCPCNGAFLSAQNNPYKQIDQKEKELLQVRVRKT